MKQILFTALVAAVVMGCSGEAENKVYNEGINVIPVPAELTVTDSTLFTITDGTVIVTSTKDFTGVATYLTDKIKGSTGYEIHCYEMSDSASVPKTNVISLEIDTRVPVGMEGYLLSSSSKGVTIKSRTPQGAFYGVQTLLQLLPAEIESPETVKNIAWTLPSVEVKDEPRFAYRGMMLDVVRHFMSVEDVKKQLDVLAMYKINRFHWHLTDDQGWRIEIKKYPKLTELGSVRTEGDSSTYGPFFYTQEQIKEVVAYAAERYIDVIPEIELPGHALAALTAYPEYSCKGGPFTPRIIWGVEEDVFCVGKEETFGLLEDIISEVVELFPSEYFHIGADECPKNRWVECPLCQARAKELGLKVKMDKTGAKHSVEEQLQSYAVTRVEKFLNTKGKKMIGWDEILEGGLAPSATVMSWRGEQGGLAAAQQDHDVIMTPGPGGMYLDQFQGAAEVEPTTIGGFDPLSKTYAYEPVPADLPADKQKFIIGAQSNIWTEYMLSAAGMEYMIYPRILALAELTWSPAAKKDYDSFERRINNAYVRLDFHNINYHIPMPEGVLTQNVVFTGDSALLVFSNTRNYPMVYTTNGSEPTASSKLYDKVVAITASNSVVKIATMLPSNKLSKARSIPVVKETLAPSVEPKTYDGVVKLSAGQTAGQGVRLRVAAGLHTDAAQYDNLTFGGDTVVTKFHEGNLWDMKKPSLAIFEGYVTLPTDGVYTFTTDMDQLWIDGVQVIDNPKLSRHNRMKSQKALASGKHAFKLVFNNMIKDGWPNNWSPIGFQFLAPNSTQWTNAEGEMLTY
ncbi:MAG: family 20 glycosylhydrolase [Mucinivorans sp.]